MGVRNRSKLMSTPTNLNLIDDKYHGHQAFSLKNGLVGSLGAKKVARFTSKFTANVTLF